MSLTRFTEKGFQTIVQDAIAVSTTKMAIHGGFSFSQAQLKDVGVFVTSKFLYNAFIQSWIEGMLVRGMEGGFKKVAKLVVEVLSTAMVIYALRRYVIGGPTNIKQLFLEVLLSDALADRLEKVDII